MCSSWQSHRDLSENVPAGLMVVWIRCFLPHSLGHLNTYYLVFSAIYGTLEVWPWQRLVTGVRLWEIIDSHHLKSAFLYFTPLVKRRGTSASSPATMPPFCLHRFFLFPSETLKLKQILPLESCLAYVFHQSNRKQLTRAEETTPGATVGEGSWPWVWPWSCSLSFSVSGVWKKSVILGGGERCMHRTELGDILMSCR